MVNCNHSRNANPEEDSETSSQKVGVPDWRKRLATLRIVPIPQSCHWTEILPLWCNWVQRWQWQFATSHADHHIPVSGNLLWWWQSCWSRSRFWVRKEAEHWVVLRTQHHTSHTQSHWNKECILPKNIDNIVELLGRASSSIGDHIECTQRVMNRGDILPIHISHNGTYSWWRKHLIRCRFRICWNHHIANSYRGHTSNKDLWRGSESIDYSHCTQNIRWESHNPNSQPENILCNCLCGFLWNSFLNCHIGNTRWVISIFRILPTHISHSGTHRSWRRRWISCMIDICWKTHNEGTPKWNTSNKPSWRDLKSIAHSHCNQNIQREIRSPNSQPENTKCNCLYGSLWNNRSITHIKNIWWVINILCILSIHIFHNGTQCSDKKSWFHCMFHICWRHYISNSYRCHISNKHLWRGSENIAHFHCTQNINWEIRSLNSQPKYILCNWFLLFP